jgi:hypothetical protein
MERTLKERERRLEQDRAEIQRLRDDVNAFRRVLALTAASEATEPTSKNTGLLFPLPINPVSNGDSGHGASNGHVQNARIDDLIIGILQKNGRPMTSLEIRDALLRENIPNANALIGSSHLFNVLNRMVMRAQLAKDGRNYILGAQPVTKRKPVGWECCQTVLSEVGHPMSADDIARAINDRWGLSWEAINVKWAIKDRKQIFELVQRGGGLWALKSWPEALKAAYRKAKSPKFPRRRRSQANGA